MQNRESHAAKLCAVKINEDKNTSKNKHGTNLSYGMDDSVSYISSAIQTQQRNSGCRIIYSNAEPRAWEYSWPVAYSPETYNARNISTTTTSKKSSVDCIEHTPDKILNRNSGVFKQNLHTPPGKPRRNLYTCSKCPKLFFRKDYLESRECHHNVGRPIRVPFLLQNIHSHFLHARSHPLSHWRKTIQMYALLIVMPGVITSASVTLAIKQILEMNAVKGNK
ncbi:hypothetical protein CDAR_242711 [Caerostris darwini]|uniref:C2H2-type domain-containing protein n=1 Tax=Caerostris darwini TaxID=1538125 RepID=A0AAV4SQI5_9ARAC|nr:hypothetical protein CDAR_242711 [Caerostris darwini]